MHGTNTVARWLPSLLLTFSLVALAINFPGDIVAQEIAAKQSAHLYFFTNSGCAPCRQVEPGVEALTKEGYPVTTVFLNQQPDLGRRFLVDRTPTVILVANNKIVGRHAGIIDGVTLKKWFAAVGVHSGTNFKDQQGGTKVELADPGRSDLPSRQVASDEPFVRPSTNLKGTRTPGSAIEQRAMDATVRLKVEDPAGISYATGTVIHGHQGEYLLMTCGHVFRESAGRGEITAEFGFEDGRVQTAPCHLIAYDAKARDVALVTMRTNQKIYPVNLASESCLVGRGQEIFSIGCDHGEDPTIRHSQIKNRAAYDGAIKYDIYGRPVDGRSGGGLFNENGELIGVCNAAAVEVDEGIYTALETMHWQLAQSNLQHLFENDNRMLASNNAVTMPVDGAATQTRAIGGNGMARIQRPNKQPKSTAPVGQVAANGTMIGGRNTPVAWGNPGQAADPSDSEVIIIIRSKSDPGEAKTITVPDPGPELLEYLDWMSSNSGPKEIDVAELREGFGHQPASYPSAQLR